MAELYSWHPAGGVTVDHEIGGGLHVLYGENTWRLKLLNRQWQRAKVPQHEDVDGNENNTGRVHGNGNPPNVGSEHDCREGSCRLIGACPAAFGELVRYTNFGIAYSPRPHGGAKHTGARLMRKFHVVIGEGYAGSVSCVSEFTPKLALEPEMLCELLQPSRVPRIMYLGLKFKTLGCRARRGNDSIAQTVAGSAAAAASTATTG